jgi:hypothetical protein
MTVVDGRFVFGREEHCIFCREGNVQILGIKANEYKWIHGENESRLNSGNLFAFPLLSKNMKIKINITTLFSCCFVWV